MVIVRLMGGLGNQMFQYALGRRIAEETEVEVKFDLSSGFKHDPHRRRFALGALNTKIVRAESHEIPIGMSWRSPWHRVAKAYWSMMPVAWRQVVYEKTRFQFDSSVTANTDPAAYYFGYWQNERYVLPIEDLLRREFTLRSAFSESVTALMAEIAGCRAVSMHVRRYNDVGANGKLIQRGGELQGLCDVDYYRRALEEIGVRRGTVCYIFSDDLQWAKTNLNLAIPCRYAAELCTCSDAEEMSLMASCEHHVISNSSFSWWGAWLGGNPKKVVVAPRAWIRGMPEDAVQICPKGWVRV